MNDDNLKSRENNQHLKKFTSHEISQQSQQNFSNRINFIGIDTYFNNLK